VPRAESRLLSRARPNLLLEGSESALDAALVALTPQLRQPLWRWRAGRSFRLPFEPPGALVLRDVSRMDPDQQHQLLDWLDVTGRRVQVISSTSERLFPLVERGTFLDVLYYRLNVVRVVLATK
jgi:hypothetical protein